MFANDEVALRLAEVTLLSLERQARDQGPDAFAPPSPLIAWAAALLGFSSEGAAAAAETGGSSNARMRAVADRACHALPARGAAQVTWPFIAPLLRRGTAALNNHQRYGILNVALIAASAAPGDSDESSAGLDSMLPAGLRATLPAICFDVCSSSLAASGSVDASSTLQLVQSDKRLLVPLVLHCAERAEVAGGSSGGAAVGHSVACARSTFRASAALLRELIRCRPLHAPLLAARGAAAVSDAVRRLAALAKACAEVSGDATCLAECSRLEQASKDLLDGSGL